MGSVLWHKYMWLASIVAPFQGSGARVFCRNGVIAMEALPRYYLPDEQKLFGTDLTAGAIGCALSHMRRGHVFGGLRPDFRPRSRAFRGFRACESE